MKYIIKVDYSCEAVKSGGIWHQIDSEKPFRLGPISKDLAPLPDPNCQLYLGRQSCDESDCLDV